MNLGKLQKRSGVILNPLGPVKVVVKALDRRDFPHDTPLCIHQILSFFGRITFQILHIFFQIRLDDRHLRTIDNLDAVSFFDDAGCPGRF